MNKVRLNVHGSGQVEVTPTGVRATTPDTRLIIKGNTSRGHIDVRVVRKGSVSIRNGTFTSGSGSVFSFLGGAIFGNIITTSHDSNIIINGVPYIPYKSHPAVSDDYEKGVEEFAFDSPIRIGRMETTTSASVILERAEELLAGPHGVKFDLSTSSTIQCRTSDLREPYAIDAPVEIEASTSASFRSCDNLHFHDITADASTSASVKGIAVKGMTLIEASTSASVSVRKMPGSKVKTKESTAGRIRVY